MARYGHLVMDIGMVAMDTLRYRCKGLFSSILLKTNNILSDIAQNNQTSTEGEMYPSL